MNEQSRQFKKDDLKCRLCRAVVILVMISPVLLYYGHPLFRYYTSSDSSSLMPTQWQQLGAPREADGEYHSARPISWISADPNPSWLFHLVRSPKDASWRQNGLIPLLISYASRKPCIPVNATLLGRKASRNSKCLETKTYHPKFLSERITSGRREGSTKEERR